MSTATPDLMGVPDAAAAFANAAAVIVSFNFAFFMMAINPLSWVPFYPLQKSEDALLSS